MWIVWFATASTGNTDAAKRRRVLAAQVQRIPPGTRRHIKAALKLGATMEEIMEVLKLCVVQGVQSFNLGLPILDEELERESSLSVA